MRYTCINNRETRENAVGYHFIRVASPHPSLVDCTNDHNLAILEIELNEGGVTRLVRAERVWKSALNVGQVDLSRLESTIVGCALRCKITLG